MHNCESSGERLEKRVPTSDVVDHQCGADTLEANLPSHRAAGGETVDSVSAQADDGRLDRRSILHRHVDARVTEIERPVILKEAPFPLGGCEGQEKQLRSSSVDIALTKMQKLRKYCARTYRDSLAGVS